MRRRDDDLSPFRDDPVFEALTAPATETELVGEAEAVAAFREAMPARVKRRSAARIATTTTAAAVTLAVSGGAAAAYTAHLPESWQAKLHADLPALDIPAPHHHHHSSGGVVAKPVVTPHPTVATTPTPAATGAGSPSPHASPSLAPTSPLASPSATPSLSVVVPPPSSTPTTSPTSTSVSPPASGAQLAMHVSPGARVTVGTQLTVDGTLTAPDGTAVASRRVVLLERVVGRRGWNRVGAPLQTSAAGQVTFSVPALQQNVRLVLHSRHVRSAVQKVVVIPVIRVDVAPTSAGDTSTTVTVSVAGGEPGDVVVLREAGTRTGQRASLSGSATATFTVAVSQREVIHYRAFVPRTKEHASHSLPFYVPPSGSG